MALIILLQRLDEDFQNEETYTRLDSGLMMARSAALVTGGGKENWGCNLSSPSRKRPLSRSSPQFINKSRRGISRED